MPDKLTVLNLFLLIYGFSLFCSVECHSCSNNRIPYGLEVHKNGQPVLLCSKPGCFQKVYADCDERAVRETCPTNNTWIGGFEKGYGNHQPLYLQCCEFENLDQLSDSMFTSVTVRPGEYFEGEEITIIENIKEKTTSFDFISNIRMIKGGPPNNQSVAFILNIRRFYCDRFQKPKLVKSWSWP